MTQPGPIGEEAAKLFEALGAWARSGGRADGAGSTWHTFSDGIADGSAACKICPMCQLIAMLRTARPETFAHLLDASTAMTAALKSFVEGSAEAQRDRRGSSVERIDLDQTGPA